jgi:hypothetical protein
LPTSIVSVILYIGHLLVSIFHFIVFKFLICIPNLIVGVEGGGGRVGVGACPPLFSPDCGIGETVTRFLTRSQVV